MTDPVFREPDMITRKVTAPPRTSLFYCAACQSTTALAGTSWKCAGPKAGPGHDWTVMTYAPSSTASPVVGSSALNLKRG